MWLRSHIEERIPLPNQTKEELMASRDQPLASSRGLAGSAPLGSLVKKAPRDLSPVPPPNLGKKARVEKEDRELYGSSKAARALAPSFHDRMVDIAITSESLGCIHFATLSENVELLSTLLTSGANVNERTKDGHTPILLAAKYQLFASLKLLLQSGANVNAVLPNGLASLHLLLLESSRTLGTPSLRKLLLDAIDQIRNAGLDFNIQDENGSTPLLLFCSSCNDAEVVKRLLMHGANPTIPDRYGFTPLMAAAKFIPIAPFTSEEYDTNYNVIFELLTCGNSQVSNVDAIFGFSALHWAMLLGKSRISKLLIVSDDNEETAVLISKIRKENLFHLLIRSFVQNNATVEPRAKIFHLGLIARLLGNSASSTCSGEGDTPSELIEKLPFYNSDVKAYLTEFATALVGKKPSEGLEKLRSIEDKAIQHQCFSCSPSDDKKIEDPAVLHPPPLILSPATQISQDTIATNLLSQSSNGETEGLGSITSPSRSFLSMDSDLFTPMRGVNDIYYSSPSMRNIFLSSPQQSSPVFKMSIMASDSPFASSTPNILFGSPLKNQEIFLSPKPSRVSKNLFETYVESPKARTPQSSTKPSEIPFQSPLVIDLPAQPPSSKQRNRTLQPHYYQLTYLNALKYEYRHLQEECEKARIEHKRLNDLINTWK